MSNNAQSNAEDSKTSVDSKVVTESEFIAARMAAHTPKGAGKPEPEEEKAVAEEASDEAPVKTEETEAKVEEGEKKEAPVLSKHIDLEQLSEAEIQELAAKARSKALSRFSELTQDKKALQAQIAQLQAQLAEKSKKSELDAPPELPPEIAALKSTDEVKAQAKQMREVIEWAETVLDNAEHLSPTDEVAVVSGKPLTKAAVKEHLRRARKMKDEYLPAQLESLASAAQRAALRDAWNQKARQELEWLNKDDDELKKEFDALVKSPLVEKIKKAVPEAEPDLEYILGHALNSVKGRKYHALTEEPKETPAAQQPKRITPPAAVKTAAAVADNASIQKRVAELEKRYSDTRSDEDFMALRTAQLQLKRR